MSCRSDSAALIDSTFGYAEVERRKSFFVQCDRPNMRIIWRADGHPGLCSFLVSLLL